MYEIVLMAAMTSSPQAVDRCGHRNRCHCSCSCYCSGYYGGHCSGYGGWCGGSGVWHGCCGGGMWYPGGGGERLGPPKKKDKGEEARAPAPATLIVSVPAGARLLIDDRPTASTSSQRVFVSPPLVRGYEYVYNLTATVQRNGEPVSTTQRVTVRAGESVRVNIEVPAVATAAATD